MGEILNGKQGEFDLGKLYEESLDNSAKRSYGKYYTGDFIIDFILEKTTSDIDVVKNPFIKVLEIIMQRLIQFNDCRRSLPLAG